MHKEQKEVTFPSVIFIFARILLFVFLYLETSFHVEYLRILLLIISGDIESNLLWYLLKPKTRLLTSRTKLHLPLENQYTNTDV